MARQIIEKKRRKLNRRNMKSILITCSLLLSFHVIIAQKYISEKSEVVFFSEAPMENIEAHNKNATSVFDASSGEIVFSVPIKSFQFEKSLMQEHFNENYMESDKFPKSTFKGKVSGFQNKEGIQKVSAEGSLLIHGVTKNVKVTGDMQVKEGKIFLNAKFPVSVAEYDIKIPKIVFYNIAEVVDVTLNFQYKPYEK